MAPIDLWFCACLDSSEDRRLTQSRSLFTAGQAWRTPQPLQIKSVELNWVKGRTSREPNWLNWVRLMWSTLDLDKERNCETERNSLSQSRNTVISTSAGTQFAESRVQHTLTICAPCLAHVLKRSKKRSACKFVVKYSKMWRGNP